jgi:hypothetical protein
MRVLNINQILILLTKYHGIKLTKLNRRGSLIYQSLLIMLGFFIAKSNHNQ